MEYAELVQQVQAAAALDRATAERVTWATMVMLAKRMHHDELVPLGARLPHELQAAVQAGSPTCQPFGADEFVRRVAERVGVEPQAAWTQVRGVLGTLERRWPRWRRSGSGCRPSSPRSWPNGRCGLKPGIPFTATQGGRELLRWTSPTGTAV